MFSQLFAVATIATLAVSLPTAPPVSQCNTGSLQCCNSVQGADSPAAAGIAGLLGIVIQDVTAQVGLGCSPITAVGLSGGASCSAKPVCCQGNDYHGLINIGCSPISL